MCMHVCVCVCVCFKVAVWFCSELTRAPEVIKIRCRRRLLERVEAFASLVALQMLDAQRWCVLLHALVCINECMCWRAGVVCSCVCVYAFV